MNFPTFRAACRRHLGPGPFARVDAAYLAAADRVDAWISERIRQLIGHRDDDDWARRALDRAQQLVHRHALLEERGLTLHQLAVLTPGPPRPPWRPSSPLPAQ